MKIAVIGAGVAGLGAAWLLSRKHDVVVYEREGRFGGHSCTVDAPTATGHQPADVGFIVFNQRNYPNLVALFDHLGVPTETSDISLAASSTAVPSPAILPSGAMSCGRPSCA